MDLIPSKIVLMILGDDGLKNNLDIVINFLAIEEEMGLNDYGWDYYKKVNSDERASDFKKIIDTNINHTEINIYDGCDVNMKYIREYISMDICGICKVNIDRKEMNEDIYDEFRLQEIGFNFKEIDNINKKGVEIDKIIKQQYLCELEVYYDGKEQDFGRGKFYQSLPMVGLTGQRPTDIRIKEYGLLEYINKSTKVLDLGCNCGFFDISIADKVGSVVGIEYNKKLVNIGKSMLGYLGNIDNVYFQCIDFNDWYKSANNKYDAVFSFAVHYWFGVSASEYANILARVVNPGGFLFFESQNINTVDRQFFEYINEFLEIGFEVVDEGTIKDDEIIERRFYVLKFVK